MIYNDPSNYGGIIGISSEFLKEFSKLFDFLTVLDRDLIIGKGLPMLRVRQKNEGIQG